MKVFYVRHQAMGVVYEFPFDHAPTAEEIAPVLERCKNSYGEEHPKTGPYWAKVVCVENGEMTTVACAHGGSVKDVDLKACGGCPITEAGHKRWPDSDGPGNSNAGVARVGVSGVGNVRNP